MLVSGQELIEQIAKENAGLDRKDLLSVLSFHLDVPELEIRFRDGIELTLTQIKLIRQSLTKLSEGAPLQYVTGRTDFFGRTFFCGPGVLIPRFDSETLVEIALQEFQWSDSIHFVDIGAGTGCLGLTLLLERPNARGALVEQSVDAFPFLKRNRDKMSAIDKTIPSRSEIFHADVETWAACRAEGEFDLIVANPPYIPFGDKNIDRNVLLHEPSEALFSGEGGLQHLRSWAGLSARLLKENGHCFFEIGFDQGQRARALFNELFVEVEIHKDLNHNDRVVCARQPKGRERWISF